jgi:hypothetical protein
VCVMVVGCGWLLSFGVMVNFGIKLVVLLADATAWKYLVLLSPCLSQFIQERCFHLVSYIPARL